MNKQVKENISKETMIGISELLDKKPSKSTFIEEIDEYVVMLTSDGNKQYISKNDYYNRY